MKILLLGSNGQVGWQLRRSLAVLGDVTALHRTSTPLCGDLALPDELARTVQSLQPEVVVNAAAYTAVDRAEGERDLAFAINAQACEVLARETQRLGAWLVHYSTDYVFDGSGEKPWTEADATSPINTYGASKLAGEAAIAAHNPLHLIMRTSWVFDSWGQNFLKSILRAASSREQLTVVADQWGAPTRAALIADVTAHVLRKLAGSADAASLSGTYHLAAAGVTSWHGYAVHAVGQAQARGMRLTAGTDQISPIPAAKYRVAAARPANSRLDTSLLRGTFGLALPTWQEGVSAVVAELCNPSLV